MNQQRFCANCGQAIAPGAGFCADCGARIAPVQAAGAPSAAPVAAPRKSSMPMLLAVIAIVAIGVVAFLVVDKSDDKGGDRSSESTAGKNTTAFHDLAFTAPSGWALEVTQPDVFVAMAANGKDLQDALQLPQSGARIFIKRTDPLSRSQYAQILMDQKPAGTVPLDVRYGKGKSFEGMEVEYSDQHGGLGFKHREVMLLNPSDASTPFFIAYVVPQGMASQYDAVFSAVLVSLEPRAGGGQSGSGGPQASSGSGQGSSGNATEGDLCAYAMPDGYKWAYNNVKQGRGDLCYVWADPVPFGATCGAPPERPVDKCENKGAEVTIRRYISPSVAAAGLKTEFKCCNGKASNVGETSSEGDLPFGIKFQRGRDVISVVRMGTYTEPQIRQLAKDIDTKIR